MIFYISVAFLIDRKQHIFRADPFELPQIMTELTMNTESEVIQVFRQAKIIKD